MRGQYIGIYTHRMPLATTTLDAAAGETHDEGAAVITGRRSIEKILGVLHHVDQLSLDFEVSSALSCPPPPPHFTHRALCTHTRAASFFFFK